MSQYLSNDALRARLRTRGLKVGGSRSELMQRCCSAERPLVTTYERLASRNAADSRRAWLEHELAQVGCVRRSDSRLCDAYIDDGDGDPREVAAVMAEMAFYFAHTDYAAIRDEIYRKAQAQYERERDACGGWDFDADEASDIAKNDALQRWLASNTSDDAWLDPVVPATLRRTIVAKLFETRLTAWVRARAHAGLGIGIGIGTHDAMASVASLARRLEAKVARPDDITDVLFDEHLGRALDAHLVTRAAEMVKHDRVHEALRGMGLDMGVSEGSRVAVVHKFARDALYKWNPSPGIVRAVSAAVTETAAAVQNEYPRRSKHRWCCTLCTYEGNAHGISEHSRSRHGARDVLAVTAETRAAQAVAFDTRVRAAFVQHVAARHIQRAWRRAIACPDFAVCRRRLLSEAAALVGALS
jgi:hypothetical protein